MDRKRETLPKIGESVPNTLQQNQNQSTNECNSASRLNKNTNVSKKKLKLEELIIILLNIRSLKEKLAEIEIILNELKEKPHVIVITETWLKEDEIKFYNLKNYQSIANCRKDSRGGGIIIYIRDDINFNIILNENFDKSHIGIINLNELDIKICGIYRSPATSPKLFLEKLDNLLEKTENLICLGDFNFNILNDNDINTRNYLDMIQINNFTLLNEINDKNYTYSENRGEYKSILDHVISDNSLKIGEFKIELKGVSFSDHRLLLFSCKLKIENKVSPKQFQLTNYEMVANELNSFEYTKYTYHEYLEFLRNVVNKYTKSITIRESHNDRKNWIDNEIKIELKKRKNLFDMKKKNPNNVIYRSAFNKQKKLVRNAIIEKKKKYFDEKFEKTLNNPKLFWKNINELIYNKQGEKGSDIAIKNDSGKILSISETAELLNNYYIDLPQNLLEREYGDLSQLELIFTGGDNSPNSIFMNATNEQEIFKIISNLKNSNSVGTDGISSKLYKKCAEPLSNILAYYINRSIETGLFPENLKMAKIIPIYKKCGEKSDYKMYRPISILKVESKIFEACIYERLYNFLDAKQFFEKNQFGFTRNSNTTSACISYIDQIQRALNEKKNGLHNFS